MKESLLASNDANHTNQRLTEIRLPDHRTPKGLTLYSGCCWNAYSLRCVAI